VWGAEGKDTATLDAFFDQGGAGEAAQQVVVLGTDRGARVAVGDLVGSARLLIGQLCRVVAVIGRPAPVPGRPARAARVGPAAAVRLRRP
jgi:hypothetical protein